MNVSAGRITGSIADVNMIIQFCEEFLLRNLFYLPHRQVLFFLTPSRLYDGSDLLIACAVPFEVSTAIGIELRFFGGEYFETVSGCVHEV